MPKPIDQQEVTEPPYQSAGPANFRLHIDHMDNDDGRIWAVHNIDVDAYLTARRVHIYNDCVLGAHPRRAEQPRAYLSGRGHIIQRDEEVIEVWGYR